jgi:hypothetical protein
MKKALDSELRDWNAEGRKKISNYLWVGEIWSCRLSDDVSKWSSEFAGSGLVVRGAGTWLVRGH